MTRNNRVFGRAFGGVLVGVVLSTAHAEPGGPTDHGVHHHHRGALDDGRELVVFPEALRRETLANMRDHLVALQQIQEALGEERYGAAAAIAEERLGMSSLRLHGAHEVGKFMPAGMRDIGGAMHRAASQFAVAAENASITGDVRPVLTAYSRVLQQCVACHASYRVQ